MKNLNFKSVVVTGLLIVLAGCNSSNENEAANAKTCAEAGDNCHKFTVLHTNDNHGRFWENSKGEYGMAARKTLVEQIRAQVKTQGGETILLSGGDINTGVPESDLQDALPDFIGMNHIGYDAMAVGNHEFDNPLAVLDSQRSIADFPMLAANIYHQDGITRYFEPYKIFNVNGVRIAVIGLTTKDTAKIGNPEFISDLIFTDPQTETAKVIAEIKANKTADLIFAVTHMGHFANGQHGSNAPGDVALARALNQGDLQAIIGGHSQNPVCMEAGTEQYAEFTAGDECRPDMQNGTYIMQAHEWGKYVGRADFEYFNGQLNLVNYQLIPVNLKKTVDDGAGGEMEVFVTEEITQDASLKSLLAYYQDIGQEQLDEVIATSDGLLEGLRAIVRNQQTNLGHLIAQAQRTKVNADVAVMNSGGVRASINQGEITYRDVLLVQPFGNTVTLTTLTGTQMANYLGAVAAIERNSGGYAQIVGVTMTIDCLAKTAVISDINGKGFDATANYTLTVPSFNAAGGDGYPVLDAVQAGYVDAEVLYTFFKDTATISASAFEPTASDLVYINSASNLGCTIAQ